MYNQIRPKSEEIKGQEEKRRKEKKKVRIKNELKNEKIFKI